MWSRACSAPWAVSISARPRAAASPDARSPTKRRSPRRARTRWFSADPLIASVATAIDDRPRCGDGEPRLGGPSAASGAGGALAGPAAQQVAGVEQVAVGAHVDVVEALPGRP